MKGARSFRLPNQGQTGAAGGVAPNQQIKDIKADAQNERFSSDFKQLQNDYSKQLWLLPFLQAFPKMLRVLMFSATSPLITIKSCSTA
jgi:hypothetical protein